MQAEHFQNLAEVAGPADGHGGGGDGIFQDQVPADDRWDQFADAGIGIAISAAGARERGSALSMVRSTGVMQHLSPVFTWTMVGLVPNRLMRSPSDPAIM